MADDDPTEPDGRYPMSWREWQGFMTLLRISPHRIVVDAYDSHEGLRLKFAEPVPATIRWQSSPTGAERHFIQSVTLSARGLQVSVSPTSTNDRLMEIPIADITHVEKALW